MITLPPFSKEQLISYTYLQALMINVVQTYFLSFIFITLINDKTVTIFQKATHLLYLFRALTLGNANAILFYNSKNSLYHYIILFYNTSTSQTSIFLFHSLK